MSSPRIAIIDYGMGNLFSIFNAISSLGGVPEITSQPESIFKADAVVFPGVGAFPEAMKNLQHMNLDRVIKDVIRTGKPFLGICLGFQLLFSNSEEFDGCTGLSVFSGKVCSLKEIKNSSYGSTVFHFLAQHNPNTLIDWINPKLINDLKEIKTNDGSTPFHYLAKFNPFTLTDWISYPPKITIEELKDIKDSDGRSIFH